MPETPVSEPENHVQLDSTESKTTDKKEYPETIFKSSYHLGEHLLQLFVNHRAVSKSFSFIIRKGKWNTIYNLTEDEKIPFINHLVEQLSPAQLLKIKETIEKRL